MSAFDCPFCQIAASRPGNSEIMVVEPLEPVTGGHLLIVPRLHIRDAAADPNLAARCFFLAATAVKDGLFGVAHGDANIITSIGAAASQTVFHFHLHIVPRTAGDHLLLPWSDNYALADTVVHRARLDGLPLDGARVKHPGESQN